MVGIGGLEPPTSSLSETRSNQLSYMPIELQACNEDNFNKMSTNCNTFSNEVVPGGRIELPTRGFSGLCSTTELPRPVRRQTKQCNIQTFACILYVTNIPAIISHREKAGAKREIPFFCYNTKYTNISEHINFYTKIKRKCIQSVI